MKKSLGLILLCAILVPAGLLARENPEKLSPAREAAEWTLTLGGFAGGLLLDRTPAWPSRPLIGGSFDKPYKKDTVPTFWLYGGIGVFTLGFIAAPNSAGWMNRTTYDNTKGFLESCSLTFLLTSLTKDIFGRYRPSARFYPRDERKDAKKSFISGHASISFAAATYATLFAFDQWKDGGALQMTGKILLSGTLFAGAAYVSATRVRDNKHFVSDVVAGGLTGTIASALIYALQNDIFGAKPVLSLGGWNLDAAMRPGGCAVSFASSF